MVVCHYEHSSDLWGEVFVDSYHCLFGGEVEQRTNAAQDNFSFDLFGVGGGQAVVEFALYVRKFLTALLHELQASRRGQQCALPTGADSDNYVFEDGGGFSDNAEVTAGDGVKRAGV